MTRSISTIAADTVLVAAAVLWGTSGLVARADEKGDPSTVQVRVVEARPTTLFTNVVLSGDIQPQSQTNVAFRTNGKVSERRVEVGDHVDADQVLARLEPLTQRANLDDAKAALVSAEAQLTQAKLTYDRQKQLLGDGYTTRTAFDNAEQQLRTTQATTESAKAALGSAQEQFSYTELRAGVAGIVMSRSFETGQVVQAAQTVLVLAQDGPRDAVFNIYEALTAAPPQDGIVDVALQADPAVRSQGRVRELSPTIDPSSGTVRAKIGLDDTPPAMGLGAVVIGRGRFGPRDTIVLPWSALFRWENQPAVWVYDPRNATVSVRTVRIDRYGPDTIALDGGVDPGERVVVAGIQFLRPGQNVVLAPEASPSVANGVQR